MSIITFVAFTPTILLLIARIPSASDSDSKMTPASVVEFPTAESNFLNMLPLEIRLRIYEFFYADLISELSDNLFGVFSLYDFLYDYTRSSLESHIGKTSLTTLLYTCKQVHNEALQVLCKEAEFVLNIMGDDDSDDEERAELRFSKDSRQPLSDGTNERLINRIHRFLEAIDHGVNLRSLKIRVSSPNLANPQSLEHILFALSTLKTGGNRIEVYLGEVAEEMLGVQRLDLFIDTIHGVNMGRGHHAFEPSHYDY
ncbi:hypothetical protein EKO27_g11958 [Xylaria grammica]|uniref:F-box domain-containing protein n=1 Tax=Xylaria grammica TaxID=363999 RepID=A0A439CLW0_9PEZI|nr:hypothetical protein EKO27_g11958 [Xylaria grammica]